MAGSGAVTGSGAGVGVSGSVCPHSSQNAPRCPVAPQKSQVLATVGIIDYFLP
jgi:hypothetical protein